MTVLFCIRRNSFFVWIIGNLQTRWTFSINIILSLAIVHWDWLGPGILVNDHSSLPFNINFNRIWNRFSAILFVYSVWREKQNDESFHYYFFPSKLQIDYDLYIKIDRFHIFCLIATYNFVKFFQFHIDFFVLLVVYK